MVYHKQSDEEAMFRRSKQIHDAIRDAAMNAGLGLQDVQVGIEYGIDSCDKVSVTVKGFIKQ
jgi:hypothetical protein